MKGGKRPVAGGRLGGAGGRLSAMPHSPRSQPSRPQSGDRRSKEPKYVQPDAPVFMIQGQQKPLVGKRPGSAGEQQPYEQQQDGQLLPLTMGAAWLGARGGGGLKPLQTQTSAIGQSGDFEGIRQSQMLQHFINQNLQARQHSLAAEGLAVGGLAPLAGHSSDW